MHIETNFDFAVDERKNEQKNLESSLSCNEKTWMRILRYLLSNYNSLASLEDIGEQIEARSLEKNTIRPCPFKFKPILCHMEAVIDTNGGLTEYWPTDQRKSNVGIISFSNQYVDE